MCPYYLRKWSSIWVYISKVPFTTSLSQWSIFNQKDAKSIGPFLSCLNAKILCYNFGKKCQKIFAISYSNCPIVLYQQLFSARLVRLLPTDFLSWRWFSGVLFGGWQWNNVCITSSMRIGGYKVRMGPRNIHLDILHAFYCPPPSSQTVEMSGNVSSA